jgi:hypothetical protein
MPFEPRRILMAEATVVAMPVGLVESQRRALAKAGAKAWSEAGRMSVNT